MPKKRFYRQRAHCNPLNDTVICTPACPGDVNWSQHYPAFFKPNAAVDTADEPTVSIADIGCGFGGMSVTCVSRSSAAAACQCTRHQRSRSKHQS